MSSAIDSLVRDTHSCHLPRAGQFTLSSRNVASFQTVVDEVGLLEQTWLLTPYACVSQWVCVSVDVNVCVCLRAADFGGASVTIPHKETIGQFIDRVDPAAQVLVFGF